MSQIKMPSDGLAEDALYEALDTARENDVAWREGRLGLYVHFGGEDVLRVAKEAYMRYFSLNALGPTAFPSLARFEREVIAWTADLLHAGPEATGNISSGGTESIFLAMKSIRDWARSQNRGGAEPCVVAPYSAHPAFSKAADLLGMQVKRVALLENYRADVGAMREAVDENTVGIMGSAPGFPHGVVDDIEGIAAIARDFDLWMHVDGCVGGFVLPFASDLQYPVPEFDFAVEGVRSMSADLHKYGFAAKGASTVIYRSAEDHAHQLFEFDEWPRGRYAAPTMAGSRPGGAVAAAWAVMRYLGRSGYTRIVRDIMATRDALIEGIEAIDELEVIGKPEGPIVTYQAHGLDIFAVAEGLTERGWFVTKGAEPPCIHLGMLTAVHVPIVEDYLRDLRSCVQQVRAGRTAVGSREVTYGG